MGSGKTTLARNLAQVLDWSYLPRSRHATRFLPDLFNDQTRWAFDTQIAFLVEKALQVIRASELGQDIVLDRSIEEDIFIFASYFYDTGAIDKRSFETYRTLAEYFVSRLPTAAAILYCKCESDTAIRRVEGRKTGILFKYPSNHLSDIESRYRRWRSTVGEVPIIDVDTERTDFRSLDSVRKLIEGPVAKVLQEQSGAQLQIFPTSLTAPTNAAKSRRNRQANPHEDGHGDPRHRPTSLRPSSLATVYIAAPFTRAAATLRPSAGKARAGLFEDDTYGIIPKGPYRTALVKLAQSFQRIGFSTLLPHRDVNRWGRVRISSPVVFEQCSYHVSHSDLFVGILGQSHGSHYEFGLALGLGKPCICITCQEVDESFVATGIRTEGRVLHWRCSNLSDLPNLLKAAEVREFVYSSIGK